MRFKTDLRAFMLQALCIERNKHLLVRHRSGWNVIASNVNKNRWTGKGISCFSSLNSFSWDVRHRFPDYILRFYLRSHLTTGFIVFLFQRWDPVNVKNFISQNVVHLAVCKHIKLLVNSAHRIDKERLGVECWWAWRFINAILLTSDRSLECGRNDRWR